MAGLLHMTSVIMLIVSWSAVFHNSASVKRR